MSKHKKIGLIALVVALLFVAGVVSYKRHRHVYQPAPKKVIDQIAFLNDTVYPATVLMYDQDYEGTLKMTCTATAIGKDDEGYYFASAGHCVAGRLAVYLSRDNPGPQTFYPALVLAQGHVRCDCSLLYAKTKDAFQMVPLGVDPSQVGEPIMDVNGVGAKTKQAFFGWISALQLTRPTVLDDGTIWTGDLLFELPGEGPGSSGSALVCENQDAICGITVGHGEGDMIAIPVSIYEEWVLGVKNGTIPAR